ncbi:acyl carrier protein [Aquabacterium sp.]|uniref:acyl carrier protein n=1 Tax=Aquabacterium sp. TaxID=1872578 RepID=UPI0035C6F1C0
MTAAIKDTVRAFIVDSFLMGGEQAGFADTDSFLEHHIVDSTGFLELIMFLEETYGIQVTEDEMLPDNLDSLAAIEAYVQRKKAA